MDDFELRLKDLPLCKPSKHLRERIFGRKPMQSGLRRTLYRRIPLGLAALFSLMMGLMGFFIAHFLNLQGGVGAPPRQGSVNVQIIYQAPANRNIFDFTEPSVDFLPTNTNIKVKTGKEA